MNVYDPYASDGESGLRSPPPGKPDTTWMVSVADMFSLLLTFFVMMYAMSTLPQDRWSAVSGALMQQMQVVVDEEVQATPAQEYSVSREQLTYARGLDYLYTIMEKRFATPQMQQQVQLSRSGSRITLSLVGDALFAPDSASLSPASDETLRQISLFLASIGNRITLEGHTDETPHQSKQFPSNWELSLSRATRVAEALQRHGYPYGMEIYGMGSTRYATHTGTPPETRAALARRVDIIVRETVAKH